MKRATAARGCCLRGPMPCCWIWITAPSPLSPAPNCGTGLSVGTGLPGSAVQSTLGIVKAYTSRVGAGPFPTEQENATGDKIRERGHEYGTTTGRPRRCGWLDAVALKYTAAVTGTTGLSLMLLDVLSTFAELKICTAYKVRGETTTWFPADSIELQQAEPQYEILPGWAEDISACRDFDDLPTNAKAYIAAVSTTVCL